MADELAGLGDELETPAAQPPVQAPADIEAVKQEYENRIKGFQRLLDERDRAHGVALAELTRQLTELRTSSMSEEEREEFERVQEAEEITRLRRENELLKLSREYPEEVPLFEQLLSASTPKEQLDLLRQIRAARAEAAATEASAESASGSSAGEEEPEVPDIDLNNPMRSFEFVEGATFNGVPITEEWADRVLGGGRR